MTIIYSTEITQSHGIITILVLVIITIATDAAQSIGFFHNPNYPGKCFVNESMILSPGDIIYYPTCSKLSCSAAADGVVTIVSCGVYSVPPGCTIYHPRGHENYPACCEVAFRCDNENELVEDHERIKKPILELSEKWSALSTVKTTTPVFN